MVDTLEILIVINSRNHGSTLSFGFSESRAKIESQHEQGGYSFGSGYFRNCSMGERILSFVRVRGICSVWAMEAGNLLISRAGGKGRRSGVYQLWGP
jgi:hypothetical protein